jgi:hypothetical protein
VTGLASRAGSDGAVGEQTHVIIEHVPAVDYDGFEVVTPSGLVGWVEEVWLGESDEPAALALRLLDGRRGLLLVTDVRETVAERCVIRVPATVRLLELQPPHLETGRDGPAASWTCTGAIVVPPEPPGHLHQAILSMHRPVVPQHGQRPERPIWQILLGICAGAALLALAITGLCILVAYLVTGGPPY